MGFSSTDRPQDQRVVILRCESYTDVLNTLQTGLSLLGGLAAFTHPGETLLLKPNLLLGDKPERGSTTNPVFFEAVAKVLQAEGIRLMYGDSPGFGTPQATVQSSGLKEIADALGIELADFVNGRDVPNPDGQLLKIFHLAAGLDRVDGVINLPKFKTHGLMRLTGATKNLFGCLPGVQKAGFHTRLQDEFRFAEMLVDLAESIAPRLHIMDAVLGMEGNGPRNGTMRNVGAVLISNNPHALDYCAAQMMNLDPMLVPTLAAAMRRKLFEPETIEILGDGLEPFIMPDYDVNRSRASTTGPHGFYVDLFKNWVTPRPVIDPAKCTSCGRCVRVCPVEPKALSFKNGRKNPPVHAYNRCIRCYCCQEMCPEEAISIETPPLGRFFDRIRL